MHSKESQNTEFKSNWHDEYLKHICAFANTRGGSLFIGVGDDGTPVGVKNTKKLLEDIPNKAINFLGIIVDVHLKEEAGKEYLEIVIPQSSVPIAYKGVYYVKSGSTKQELKGAELQHFILKKMGRTFDELPAEGAELNDIDEKIVRKFLRKAIKANRLSPDVETDDFQNVISNLKLVNESGKLKNAAILLFGNDPLRFFSSVSFRIGRFGDSDHDLRFQDVIEGNIFEMPDKVIETLRAKYLISPIRYEGLQRIEELEYPEEALREAILNSVIHKDYTGVHVQLSVYDDKIVLWNPGKLPDEIPIDKLMQKHPSVPRNRHIADIFFKAGYIEAWGRGIDKINQGFINAGKPTPVFEELAGGFMLTLFKSSEKGSEKGSEKSSEKVLMLINKNPKTTATEIAKILAITPRAVEKVIARLKAAGKLKRIGPAKGGYWEIIGSDQ
jgi:ATP-dependent DNA helicase RecG